MKSTILLLVASMVLMIYSCDGPNVANTPVSGEIVGTIYCRDTVNQRNVQGYYIITDTQDSILSFNEELRIDIHYGVVGSYGIPHCKIPFRFTYKFCRREYQRTMAHYQIG